MAGIGEKLAVGESLSVVVTRADGSADSSAPADCTARLLAAATRLLRLSRAKSALPPKDPKS